MKKMNDPLSFKRVLRSIIVKNKKMTIFMVLILIFSLITCNYYEKERKNDIFNKLAINFKEVKAIEYGTPNYDPMDLIDNVPKGEIISYTEDVDTNSIGPKEVSFVVKEEDVYKVVNVEVEVVDTKKPDIEIQEDNIEIEEGNELNINDNIKQVFDQVDGDLDYKEDNTDDDYEYYTVTTDLNTEVAGNYEVNIKAVDKNGNVSEKKFSVNVVPKPVVEEETTYEEPAINNNVSSTVDTSSVVSAAESFIGYNYTYGGASPETGFDCSGFVHYIYGLFGKNIGRSTTDIIYDGVGISKDSMQPGDIILWDTSFGNTPSHASLYVGNDTMIHAANSNDGVIYSSVSNWEMYAGRIVSIRRI